MSLRRAVAAPFRQRGVEQMSESELVVALSLDRDWFSPDQAKQLIDAGAGEGLLERAGEDVRVTFNLTEVSVPEDFEPDEGVIQQRSTFQQLLELIVENGVEKQTAVAEINQLQAKLGVTIEAAAALYARRQGIDVSRLTERATRDL
jgi:hypothetical protein